MAEGNVGFAFALTFAAGLSTTIGAAAPFAVLLKRKWRERRKQGADVDDDALPSASDSDTWDSRQEGGLWEFETSGREGFADEDLFGTVESRNLLLAGSLAASAGVMLYVSFGEIVQKSIESFLTLRCSEESDTPEALAFSQAHEDQRNLTVCEVDEETRDAADAFATTIATVCVFAGILLMYLLDAFVHCLSPTKDPHELETAWSGLSEQSETSTTEGSAVDSIGATSKTLPESPMSNPGNDDAAKRLGRTGKLAALALAIHNFPEGLATFVAALVDERVGIGLAVAIAIHNIPEGVCVSMPIFYSTGSAWKGFLLGVLSGVSEPAGALIGFGFASALGGGSIVYGILFGLVAGMMLYIVIKELLPESHRHDPKDRVVSICTFVGMLVMAISLALFKW